ncbi:DUF6221 family protein [Streptomyces rochei]|uniref:DUF6221 family protein n=1 Tax=Streptomyces rochei TaxID=1928 RepID=UPI002ACD59E8|nr:DUF6221 family protein [Streptomyces rochei]WQC16529.1 DUF6221 family protein [Streptomyces rochei]
MDDLVQWLRAQLDEDERIARAADDSLGKMNLDWTYQPEDKLGGKVVSARGADLIYDVAVGIGEHVSVHDPRRVLREIDVKRRVIVGLQHLLRGDDPFVTSIADDSLRALAEPYADRPGYRDQWRP